MRNYNFAVLGTSGTQWTQAEQQRLDTGEMLLYSGYKENDAPHTQGVVLMLSEKARSEILGGDLMDPGSSKHASKQRRGDHNECYPMLCIHQYSNDDNKDQSYERLKSIIGKCPRKDLNILMGDLNAKFGMNNKGYEDIMGRHELGERNENGERFRKYML
ncbi:unnamed protein product [Schistosoma curassoni]|nr:unnamed protein product [Schistosoma curassoni]